MGDLQVKTSDKGDTSADQKFYTFWVSEVLAGFALVGIVLDDDVRSCGVLFIAVRS